MGGFSKQSALTRTFGSFADVFDRWKIAATLRSKRLDPEQLKAELHGLLHANCVGYAFQLRQYGKTVMFGHDGAARIEPGAEVPLATGGTIILPSEVLPFGQDTIMTIGSLGKLFTAVLTVRLLDRCNIDVDDAIGPHLPSWWDLKADVKAVTFRQLLTHTSRLGVGYEIKNDSVAETRSILSKTITGNPDYRNINFIVLRILIYRILKAHQNPAPASPPGVTPMPGVRTSVDLPETDDELQQRSIEAFEAYAQDHLFGPTGVTASLRAPGDVAYHFRYPYGGGHGTVDDISDRAGSAGWFMSLNDTLRTMAAFRRRGVAISPNRSEELETQGLGFYPMPGETDIGLVAFKNGGSNAGPNPPYIQQTVGAFLPDGMELVVFVDSNVLGTEDGSPNLMGRVMTAVYAAIRPWSLFGGFG
jgi:CubicO group peptidase (beta-lactamase class C family)